MNTLPLPAYQPPAALGVRPDLRQVRLEALAHPTRADGVCLLECAAWWGGCEHSDRPECVSPVLAEAASALSDALDDNARQRLRAWVPALASSVMPEREAQRAQQLVALAREQAPGSPQVLAAEDALVVEDCIQAAEQVSWLLASDHPAALERWLAAQLGVAHDR